MITIIQKKFGKRVGYFRNSLEDASELPFPVENSCTIPPKLMRKFVSKLSSLILYSRDNGCYDTYKGYSNCRICNEIVGRDEYAVKVKDKFFIVPEGFLHYIEKHNIQPDMDLFNSIMN